MNKIDLFYLFSRFFSRNTLFLIGGVAIVLGASSLFLRLTVDEDAIVKSIISKFEENTGRKISVNGDISLSLLPLPSITLEKVFVANHRKGKSDHIIGIDSLTVRPKIGSIFSDNPEISSYTLENPSLNLEILEDDVKNWDLDKENNLSFLTSFLAKHNIIIRSGTITYLENSKKSVLVKNLDIDSHITGIHNNSFQIKSTIPIGKTELITRTNIAISENDNHEVIYEIISGENMLSGKFDMNKDNEIEGNYSLIAPKAGINASKFSKCDFGNFSLNSSANIAFKDSQISFKDFTVSSDLAEFSSVFVYNHDAETKTFSSNSKFNKLDFQRISELQKKYSECFPETAILWNNLLASATEDLVARLVFEISEVATKNGNMTNVKSDITVQNDDININSLSISLPENNVASFIGTAEFDNQKELFISGNIETSGNSLNSLLKILSLNPQLYGFKEITDYKLSSNLNIGKNETRLSEINAQIGSSNLSGSMIIKNDSTGNTQKVEAKIKADKIDADNYYDGSINDLLTKTSQINSESEISFNIDEIKHKEHLISVASGILRVAKDGLKIKDSSMVYQDGNLIAGDIDVTSKNNRPHIRFNGTVSSMNANWFYHPVEKDEKFRFKNLDWLDGEFNVKSNQIEAFGAIIKDSLFQANLDNSNLTIKDLSGEALGGNIKLNGTVKTATLPSVAIAFAINNCSIAELSKFLLGDVKINDGRVGISGNIETAGVDKSGWISSSSGSFSIAARDMILNEIDISGFARKIPNVRTSADVASISSQFLSSGQTKISNAEGNFFLNKGIITSSNLRLKSEEANASSEISINLNDRTQSINNNFILSNVGTADNQATFSISYSGSIDAPKKQVDTSGIEKFISR